MKVESSGFSANTILKKPECFAHLLRFYDGICQWEEGSATPVLHIGWAKPLVNTISKFDAEVRAQVNIVCDNVEEIKKNGGFFNNNNNNYEKENGGNDSTGLQKDDKETVNFHPTLEALTAACSEKILNPEFLLQGDGSPFVGGDESSPTKSDDQDKTNGKPSTSKDEERQPTPPPEEARRPTVTLHSQKMKELKDLLLAEKLNTHAISLHLTAQSQVQIGKKTRGEGDSGGGTQRPKRARRE